MPGPIRVVRGAFPAGMVPGGGAVPAPRATGATIERALVASGAGAPSQLTRQFIFQSYLDTTKLEQAVLQQDASSQIVLPVPENIAGYSLGLHPSSQTPVAVQFGASGSRPATSVYVLKPGQIVRPHGLPRGASEGGFSGFTYGLPFGWLGGGLATIVVFPSPDAEVNWPANTELTYHRVTLAIRSGSANLAQNPNWPVRFPWPNAIRNAATNVPQYGAPVVAIANPTKVIFRLRGSAVPSSKVRLFFFKSDDFETNSDGTLAAANVNPAFYDLTWPGVTLSGARVAAGVVAEWPVQAVTDWPAVVGGDYCSVVAYDLSGAFAGLFLDCERRGIL